MTSSANSAVPVPEQQDQADHQRPDLRLVDGLNDIEVPAETEPQAPLTYRLHAGLAQALSQLPGVWSERQPALSEVVEYSIEGDWTVHPRRRSAHLIGVIVLCLPLGIAAVVLGWLAKKPSRVLIVLAALLLLGYAL